MAVPLLHRPLLVRLKIMCLKIRENRDLDATHIVQGSVLAIHLTHAGYQSFQVIQVKYRLYTNHFGYCG